MPKFEETVFWSISYRLSGQVPKLLFLLKGDVTAFRVGEHQDFTGLHPFDGEFGFRSLQNFKGKVLIEVIW
jgi:hypothetical protein